MDGGREPLDAEAKDQLRRGAREAWQKETGRRAIWDGLQIHHRIPLQFAHLFPAADPNRLANLIGIRSEVHTQITTEWERWKREFDGTICASDVVRKAIQIDGQFGSHFVYPA